jgi:peptidoglycan/LPS O-acetylase OafA/YrhL
MDRHIPQLDGLRGIAVLIVILGHLLMYDFGFGIERLAPIAPTGVDLFFVLSGFLITGILWRSRCNKRYFLNFYARRALRIWPLYILMILFVFVVAERWIPTLEPPAGTHWQVFALYLQNFWYRNPDGMGMVLAVTWSLAIEEQFYLTWPLGVYKLSKTGASAILVTFIAIAPIARWLLAPNDYMNPLCRFDAIAMGSLLALWVLTRKPEHLQVIKLAQVVIFAAICGEVLGIFTGTRHYLHETMMSAMFTGILALSLESKIFIRALSIPPLRYTGKISYCLYLSHMIVSLVVMQWIPGSSGSIRTFRIGLILAGSYGFGTLSWYSFERPILTLKRCFGRNDSKTDKSVRGVLSENRGRPS